MVALASYGSVLSELAPLISLTFALLIVIGVAMWLAERPMKPHSHESDVDTLRDGVYWVAVAHSSDADYLDERHLRYAPFDELSGALTSLGRGEVDAVVNSIGALQHLISTRFKDTIRPPQGVPEPAYMAIALPPGSPFKKQLNEALVGITASQEWRQIEDGYFGRQP
jgi:ABC-type amino acid transport substrate-binding protein